MSLRILAVDDSPTMRNLLNHTLTNAGFQVDLAEDGMEGIEHLESFDPDVIITDVNMPRLDGLSFIEQVREMPRERVVPILVLTTESAPEFKARARNAGASGWLVKPFDEVRLVQAIHRVAIPAEGA